MEVFHSQNGTNVAKLTDKDNMMGDSEQIQLANMQASVVELRAGGEELHCTGEHICQLDLKGLVDYRSSSVRFGTLDNLGCSGDNHLHLIE